MWPRCASAFADPPSVRDQALPGELRCGLRERRVRRRKDHVRAHQLVVVDGLAFAADELEHLAPEVVELTLVAGLDRRYRRVVELVQPVDGFFRHLELTLTRDSHDHAPPSLPCSRAGASAPPPEPVPSSAFIFASSSSTSAPDESCASSLSMSSCPPLPICVMSSKAPAFSSSSTAPARARMFSTLSSAR